MKEYQKRHWIDNRDKLRVERKEYYKIKKELILEKILCECCNIMICRCYKLKHEKTMKHQNSINNM